MCTFLSENIAFVSEKSVWKRENGGSTDHADFKGTQSEVPISERFSFEDLENIIHKVGETKESIKSILEVLHDVIG